MENFNNYKTYEAIPSAASLIETFRAIGYNIETAIADIIDNSISANSKNIWLEFKWENEKSWISIKDDGIGMNKTELQNALKPGSLNPLDKRDIYDLGRFGLGLKTASFSQAKQLSVISKKKEFHTICLTWDLDYVQQENKWNLLDLIPNNFDLNALNELESGTLVIWNKLDRILNNFKDSQEKNYAKFLQLVNLIEHHLSMVFHKYIEEKKINIFINSKQVEAWDPFLQKNSFTQTLPEEHLENGNIIIKGFVLPHKTRLSNEEYKNAEGKKGWNEYQGFYIYRNKRLIVYGDWLGLFRKEDHYKLARIKIELPNSFDKEWYIDIKKSNAKPPIYLKDRIKAYAMQVRSLAIEVFRHQGVILKTQYNKKQFVSFWHESKKGQNLYFKINQEHPIIQNFISKINNEDVVNFRNIIKFIEGTLPTKSIFIYESENSDILTANYFEKEEETLLNVMNLLLKSFINDGKTFENAKTLLKNLEPYNMYENLIDNLDKNDFK